MTEYTGFLGQILQIIPDYSEANQWNFDTIFLESIVFMFYRNYIDFHRERDNFQ